MNMIRLFISCNLPEPIDITLKKQLNSIELTAGNCLQKSGLTAVEKFEKEYVR